MEFTHCCVLVAVLLFFDFLNAFSRQLNTTVNVCGGFSPITDKISTNTNHFAYGCEGKSNKMANKLDLANAQIIGFYYGKWNSHDAVGLCEEMGMTKKEWIKLKKDYEINLDEVDLIAINKHFGCDGETSETSSKSLHKHDVSLDERSEATVCPKCGNEHIVLNGINGGYCNECNTSWQTGS